MKKNTDIKIQHGVNIYGQAFGDDDVDMKNCLMTYYNHKLLFYINTAGDVAHSNAILSH